MTEKGMVNGRGVFKPWIVVCLISTSKPDESKVTYVLIIEALA